MKQFLREPKYIWTREPGHDWVVCANDVRVGGHMWWSEVHCLESVLFFYLYIGPRSQTQIAGLVGQEPLPDGAIHGPQTHFSMCY